MCMSSDIIQDPAETHPAGVHSAQYVGGSDVGVGNAESNGIERDLENNARLPLLIPLERHF